MNTFYSPFRRLVVNKSLANAAKIDADMQKATLRMNVCSQTRILHGCDVETFAF